MVDLKIELPEGFLDEEERCGYVISSKMKEVWAVELDITMEILRVCRKHNIQILGDGGTALGAVRHKGFIPWDDDMDLEMTRSEYDRLCSIGPEEFKYPYFFQTEYTDHGSLRGHIQVRRTDTTGILEYEKDAGYKFNQGIFVDIFPFDKIPDDPALKEKYLKKVNRYKEIVEFLKRHSNMNIIRNNENKLKKILFTAVFPFFSIFCKLHGDTFFYKKMEKAAAAYKDEECEYSGLIVFSPYAEKYYRKTSDFNDTINAPFEFTEIPICSSYDRILKDMYGDYMKFEPGESCHGGVILDTDRSYRDYLNIRQ